MSWGINYGTKNSMKQSKFNAFEGEIFLFFDVADKNERVKVLIMNTIIAYIYSFF